MKIKKDTKPQLHKLPVLRIRYSFVVPFMGLIDMMTMISFFMNPAMKGMLFLKVFFAFFAVVGLLFMYWGLIWTITADGKRIRVRPAYGKARELALGDLKNVIVHKKAKSGSMVYYELLDKSDKQFVKIYPLMRDCGTLLERLKRLGIPIQEEKDR